MLGALSTAALGRLYTSSALPMTSHDRGPTILWTPPHTAEPANVGLSAHTAGTPMLITPAHAPGTVSVGLPIAAGRGHTFSTPITGPFGPQILAAETAEAEGVVYSRIDLNGEIEPYSGKAQSYDRYLQRQIEHARNYPDADFGFTIVDRANPGVELDVAEHQYIQQLTGGVRASKSPLVSNLKDPVGPARRPGLGLPEPRGW